MTVPTSSLKQRIATTTTTQCGAAAMSSALGRPSSGKTGLRQAPHGLIPEPTLKPVVVQGTKSAFILVWSGEPHGSVLGPCLFLVYNNDLAARVSSETRLFADDMTLYRFIAATDDHEVLQADIQKLEQWEEDWDMKFHPAKCCVLPASRSKKPTHHEYMLHSHSLSSYLCAGSTTER